MRNIAILVNNDLADISNDILKWMDNNETVRIFSTCENDPIIDGVEIIRIPKENSVSDTTTRNYISRWYKDNNVQGFLHVVFQNVVIEKDPHQFMDQIERMMDVVGLDSWFNCSCDPVNYIYRRFNPRFTLHIDDPEVKDVYDKSIILCSNANTAWICYDMDTISVEQMMFNEKYTIPMYYIIDFLASRRNNRKHGSFNYMNMYPTIEDELGVFRYVDRNIIKKEDSNNRMDEEGRMFNESGLDYHPDHDIMSISEDLRNILLSRKSK